ncbi:bifunctional methylenetetrahydrofolate dehydrogenase/methenyltetrahydrofolate cyclohydrolase FolD [Roseospirillum parvum]|uniref:Bifunctional protein FolD n=1 Tax=Roseospirillum parvum TaxID=83401 RepID=A0A1G7XUR6_9PROT|nr:bifunctional methylenetetrahydrofolate dehydrogenase/methenyltetrahydrofolate cyclohydrolase FolD [Roseospirillum parvum]SDG87932.1 methylenetetrahydrofolate dehydrogenase (NADP+) / methenyltetrahydrofolate cyclohydrolase [Roseospirillum parvum]
MSQADTPDDTGKRIDGKAFAAALRTRVGAATADLERRHGVRPGLAVVLVGEDPASQVYVRNKRKQAEEAGMASFHHTLPEATTEADLLALVERLNQDPAVHGILVQLPLPGHIRAERILLAIDPAKDVDGFHPVNAGRLASGMEALVPCTPLGCLMLLKDRLGKLDGLEAVVLGRSNIVGKPMAQLLLGANATVTVAHSRTRDLPAVARRADILVAAVGRPRMVGAEWLKPGATVIDVGINRIPDDRPDAEPGKTRLVGDVDYESALPVVGAITPVPGGVGPMTIAVLLRNTLIACARQRGLTLDLDDV